MVKVVIKGLVLNGRNVSMADKYDEPPTGPNEYDIERTYRALDEFLKTNGEIIMPEIIQKLPFIEDGFITPNMVASAYSLNKKLIISGLRPHFFGIAHLVKIATKIEDESELEKNLNLLKWEAGFMFRNYWREQGDKKIIDVPEGMEDVRGLIGYASRIK